VIVVCREGIGRRYGVKVRVVEFADIGGGIGVKNEAVDVVLENLLPFSRCLI
jgi:hypothetical protein